MEKVNTNTPYDDLTPDLILNAIESQGYICNGALSPLNSYENRVYQIGIENSEPVIAKFYRPFRWSDETILEEHAFTLELLEHDIPVIAPIVSADGNTLYVFQNYRFAIFKRQWGYPFELDNLDHLEMLGRLLGRLHAVGANKKFTHRITLDINTYGYQPYQYLLDNNFIAEDVRHNYCLIMDDNLKLTNDIFTKVGNIEYIRLHGDCHAGNILWNNNGPLVVDFDDCLTGPAIQDIWMLLSGSKADVEIQTNRILDGYCEFYDYNPRELYLVEVLRTLRMIHYSAWLARRWNDPAFPRNFTWFNTPRYWQDQLHHMQEQNEKLTEVLMHPIFDF